MEMSGSGDCEMGSLEESPALDLQSEDLILNSSNLSHYLLHGEETMELQMRRLSISETSDELSDDEPRDVVLNWYNLVSRMSTSTPLSFSHGSISLLY